MYDEKPYLIERIVSGLSYLTMGLVGVVWLIIGAVRGSYPRKFTMYHVFQSVFISLVFVILNWLIAEIVQIFSFIPLINRLVMQIVFLFNMPVFFGYSIMQVFIYGLILYLAVFAFMGMYSYIPWVSDIIKSNFKN